MGLYYNTRLAQMPLLVLCHFILIGFGNPLFVLFGTNCFIFTNLIIKTHNIGKVSKKIVNR